MIIWMSDYVIQIIIDQCWKSALVKGRFCCFGRVASETHDKEDSSTQRVDMHYVNIRK